MSVSGAEHEAIRSFLRTFCADEDWLAGTALFSSGVLDSMVAVELVMFLEQTFDIKIGHEDLDLHNFDSIDGLANLVGRKRATVSG